MVLIYFIVPLCWGGDILVLKTDAVSAYEYVVKGITQACQEKLIVLDLKGDKSNVEELKDRINGVQSKVMIVIGDEAAEFASTNLKKGNIIYSMLLEPEKYNFNKKTTLGIDILINIDQVLNYLMEIKQGIKKVGVVYNLDENERMMKYMERVAAKKQIQLIAKAISSEQEVAGVASELLSGVEAVVMMPSLITTKPEVSQYISQEALKKGIPVAGLAEIFLQHGALYTVSINPIILGRAIGQSACLIEKGTDINNIKIATPSYSVISINLKLAELLHIKFPKEIVASAYKTIK
jgi:ABC-type uncharacterized transport system substrate-binding protein